MKRYADAKRDDVSFSVGQWVYVRLRPGRQTSVTGPHHPKLSKRFFGPFMFEDRIGFVAYRLRLPPDSQVHPVFHSSLLRAHHGPPPLSTDTWPLGTLTQQPIRRPLCFLDSKMDDSTDPPTQMVLTQWVGEPPEDTTWEPWPSLCKSYHLKDKVDFGGGGIVSNSAASNPAQARPRSVRVKSAPIHLKDYHVDHMHGSS